MHSGLCAMLPLAILAAFGAAALVRAGQFPDVEGVIGAVPPRDRAATVTIATATNATTPGALRVTENSGVCETTDGVNQYSGYGDLTEDESIWFWFFESRNDPTNDPLVLWFNGGPGSSSMIGLLQELGPCRINNDSADVSLNPYSWNNAANVMFIDQPVGVGFSHGSTTVGTSQEAASDVWDFLQIWLKDKRFAHLQANDLAIWTESYGGHYGPTFAAYFLAQNDAIASGSVDGQTLNLKVLGVGDGLTDPLHQYAGYLTYATDNPYHPLVNDSEVAAATRAWNKTDGCRDMIATCYANGTDSQCSEAQSYCNNKILSPLAGPYDVYYVLATDPDPYPADITDYLSRVAETIGAETTWSMTSYDVYGNFANTGDWMRNSAIDLQTVIDAGVRTIVYVGDADYILNYPGIEAMMDALNTTLSSDYLAQDLMPYNVDGVEAGLYKQVGDTANGQSLAFLRVYGAGHEVPAYSWDSLEVGQAAFQMFDQVMGGDGLKST
ncbi:Alpha/Beta hydrolase protein [Schizophyllum amplum]|uniref:Carboxypeptidase n=1 Tax=Schizophyllum amplum TaxID=97359 RepID=A0A550CXB6_9AGAR|nr:Alpha/Beta hydrolase protein [Auriculariopsis ampla]